jgi:hypothetical protein
MSKNLRRLEKHSSWLVVLLLLFFWSRLLQTATVKSDTFDEIIHIMQGVLYWRQATLYPVVENPPLVNAIIGLPVAWLFRPELPIAHPIWQTGNWLRISQVFAWEINDNGRQLIWMGRVAIVFLALLLGALLYRWGRQLFQQRPAGLLVLLLFTFDPNVLAHSSLATTDLGTALFFCLAAYLVWRHWYKPECLSYLAAAAGLGLVLAAKYSGLIMVPAVALLAAYRLWSARRAPDFEAFKQGLHSLLEVGGWLGLGLLVFLAVYRFDLAALAADFTRQQSHLGSGHSSYLLGELSASGWWYYFPVVFVAKTPWPVLGLVGLALALVVAHRDYRWSHWWPVLIAIGIGASSLLSRVNLGYRYLLPALPLLYLPAGRLAQPDALRSRPVRWGMALLVMAAAGTSLAIHPHYLAYFNRLAGGPDEGWRIAADSNIDWGQDIGDLAAYMAAHNVEDAQVSYLGSAPLAAYGVEGRLLPVWPAPDRDPLYDPFYPPRPAPGFYALSITQLLGVYADDPDYFAWFQARPPDDKVGYSLFIYDVAADGPPIRLALSGIGISALRLNDFDRAFDSNDVRPAWYDARRSFLWPGGSGDGEIAAVWAAVGDGHWPSHPALQALYPATGPALRSEGAGGLRYALFRLDELPLAAVLEERGVAADFGWSAEPVVGSADWVEKRQRLAGKAIFDGTLELLGYEIVSDAAGQPDVSLNIVTYWRVQNPPANDLKIFLHVLDATGQVVAQHDGLDVPTVGLQAGDEFAQLHAIADLPPGSYGVQLGLYDDQTLRRLAVNVGADATADRLLLSLVTVSR